MAKQKKQKKAGVLKRKQNKKNKKKHIKKKILAQRKPTAPKPLSMSNVKKNLKNLPSLVFEPELQEIQFTPEQIKQARSDHEKLPDQIEALSTTEFQDQLKEKLELLKIKFESVGDTNRGMMVNAMQYFMEQENSLPTMNQIIVGMYLVSASKLDAPDTEFTLDQLNLKLKEYDKDWASYLEERVQALTPEILEDAIPGVTSDADIAEDEDDTYVAPPFEELVEEFNEYLSDELQIGEEELERSVEDVEVLLTDYCEEKTITVLDDLTPKRVKSFLGAWFIRKMHPTEDDLATMIQSMRTFNQFLKTREKLPLAACEAMDVHLQSEDAIMANLTSHSYNTG